MSAPDLLVVVDPAARSVDGESVRIARDVLCAGGRGVKVCLPADGEEAERALARRGSRRPVVVGDDRALLRTVRLLHRERDLDGCALGMVPVGAAGQVALARALGVPLSPVEASRAVLSGRDEGRDLLVDDSGGVVLRAVRIPAGLAGASPGPPAGRPDGPGAARRPDPSGPLWGPPLRGCRRLVQTLARPLHGHDAGEAGADRLRVEVDGTLLADLDRPVEQLWLAPGGDGLAELALRQRSCAEVRVRAKSVTVSGPDFRYRADVLLGGPVRGRTWTSMADAWHLTLPQPQQPSAA
ncbi:MAG TPA: diacylglycerol kinase [Streptomyces sp.]|nr:diacylglycerol kinase [Streptomyces sp.]